MEVSGTLIRRSVGSRWGGDAGERSIFGRKSRADVHHRAAVPVKRWSDESHSLYYASPARCGGVRDAKRKEEKMSATFGTDLSRDLAALYSAGLGMEGEAVIGGEIRAEMIKEAAEQLLLQLNQKKAKEKEMKKKKKEEKAALKARKMRDCADESSSSSSSESSDSDCEESVKTNEPTKTLEDAPVPSLNCIQVEQITETKVEEKASKLNHVGGSAAVACCSSGVAVAEKTLTEKTSVKIEVCMGGKCKKSGSMELLQELEKKVGIEGAVTGCKCMGKCREGPNVRVLNHGDALEDNLAKITKGPMCIGVGLEDVGAIVANFFGEGGVDAGLLAA